MNVRKKRTEKLGTLDVLVCDEARKLEGAGWKLLGRLCMFVMHVCLPAEMLATHHGSQSTMRVFLTSLLCSLPHLLQVSMLSAEMLQFIGGWARALGWACVHVGAVHQCGRPAPAYTTSPAASNPHPLPFTHCLQRSRSPPPAAPTSALSCSGWAMEHLHRQAAVEAGDAVPLFDDLLLHARIEVLSHTSLRRPGAHGHTPTPLLLGHP